jgi:hypothetical protein
VFDWAIGWLTREGKVVIIPKKRSFNIVAHQKAQSAGPSPVASGVRKALVITFSPNCFSDLTIRIPSGGACEPAFLQVRLLD